MSAMQRYTVSRLIAELVKMPPDAEVAVEWDDALSLFDVQTDTAHGQNVVVLHAGWWGDFYP